MADEYVPVEGAAKSADGKYMALVGGKWMPALGAAKSADGKYVAYGIQAAPAAPAGPMIGGRLGVHPQAVPEQDAGQKLWEAYDKMPYEAGGRVTDLAAKILPAPVAAAAGYLTNVAVSAMPIPGAEQAGAAKRGIETAAEAGKKIVSKIAKLHGEQQEMVGVGAAATEQSALRQARADALPVPIKLTQGQRTRTFEQQQFERETAKNPDAGAPLRERYAQQNQQVLQNFDSWVDQTGAEAYGLRAVGQVVNDAVVAKSRKAKTDIRAAYNRAKESGAMSEPVSIKPLQEYLESHQPEALNAPVIASAQAKLGAVSKGDTATINDLEELRKMVGKLAGKDATNSLYGGELKRLIDGMTDGKGGDAYKQARALRARYAREFEDVGVIHKMLSTKPGSADRSVAYEDVFAHSILKGSLDDVRAVRKTLQTGGPEGQQAWRELQGQTIRHIKDEITKNVQVDQAGNSVVSPAKLNSLVNELDKDGKLDFIFGKKGAQQVRDINDIAKDIYTAPPGSVNHSNTASILAGLLDTAVSGMTGLPLPVASAATFAHRRVMNRVLGKKVEKALQ